MATLLDFRRRIRSVRNTQQITRAMKFVSSVKLRRAQAAVFAARPYAKQILRVLRSAKSRVEGFEHPLLRRSEEKPALVVLVSGDKGLCGAFNSNVIRRGLEFIREQKQTPYIIAAGKKGRDALRKRNYTLLSDFINLQGKAQFEAAKAITATITDLAWKGEVSAVHCVYNEFKNVISQRLMVEPIFPIDPEDFLEESPAPGAEPPGHAPAAARPVAVDYIYEQSPTEILESLLPRYVEAQVYRVLLESAAAFNAAQMTAMDAATKNASELIDKVTLHMNKVRQAGITKEIIEVVSGAASAGM